MLELHDVAVLKRTTSDCPLPAGTVVTIVDILDADASAYLVEFHGAPDADGLYSTADDRAGVYFVHGDDLEEGDNSWKDARKHR